MNGKFYYDADNLINYELRHSGIIRVKYHILYKETYFISSVVNSGKYGASRRSDTVKGMYHI